MSLSKTKKLVAAGLAAVTLGGAVVVSSAPAQAGYYGYGYGGPRYYHRRNNGGAIAAGLIGGLAVGALAASAARPAYGYGAYGRPVGYAYPAYGPGYVGGDCFIQTRKYVDEWGDVVVRRRKVCD
jgi:hypothetical protein